MTHAQVARGGVQVALGRLSKLRDSKLLSAAGKKTTVVGRDDGATRSVSGRTPKREGRAFRTDQIAPLLYGEKTTYINKGAWKKSGRASERASADSREQSKETTQANQKAQTQTPQIHSRHGERESERAMRAGVCVCAGVRACMGKREKKREAKRP